MPNQNEAENLNHQRIASKPDLEADRLMSQSSFFGEEEKFAKSSPKVLEILLNFAITRVLWSVSGFSSESPEITAAPK